VPQLSAHPLCRTRGAQKFVFFTSNKNIMKHTSTNRRGYKKSSFVFIIIVFFERLVQKFKKRTARATI
jgi:hypothetical protein